MEHQGVAFIGGGNMTRAIVGGLLQDGFSPVNISIGEPMSSQRDLLTSALPDVFVSGDNDQVVANANIVVLSVKPQILSGVCRELAAAIQKHKPLLISIAAGPRISDIDAWLGGGVAIARVMPNQPALLQKGVSGMFANNATTSEQLHAARRIMSAVGPVVEVRSESEIDAVTAVSGSGPAYFFLLIDMITKTGVDLGLTATAAQQLAIETAVGAAALARDSLAQESGESMDSLIERVRSPGGTTAAALNSLEENRVRDIFHTALTAARDKAINLGDRAHEDTQD